MRLAFVSTLIACVATASHAADTRDFAARWPHDLPLGPGYREPTALTTMPGEREPAMDITMTRGAWYTLELALQDLGPCTTPAKIAKWSRLWGYLRARNDRTITLGDARLDFEEAAPGGALTRRDGESDAALVERMTALQRAIHAWNAEDLSLPLTDKQRDIARDAVRWIVANKEKSTVKLRQSEHLARLMEALGLDEE